MSDDASAGALCWVNQHNSGADFTPLFEALLLSRVMCDGAEIRLVALFAPPN
jgi:hypothetical protein